MLSSPLLSPSYTSVACPIFSPSRQIAAMTASYPRSFERSTVHYCYPDIPVQAQMGDPLEIPRQADQDLLVKAKWWDFCSTPICLYL